MKPADLIWMNGEFVAWEDAKVHVLTHGLHYGTGVFEGVRCYDTEVGPAVFRHADHIDRLFKSAELYYMPIPFDREQIRRSTLDLIAKNGMRECYIRPLVFRGYGTMGLFPLDAPVDVSILAKIESHKAGYEEAILLDDHGRVCEGSGENIFVVRDGVIYTPPQTASILDGINRKSAIQIARDLGFDVVERDIARAELYLADEIYLTGTAAELVPCVEVDDHAVGDGKPGEVTRTIAKAFDDALHGRTERYREWLDPVPVPAKVA